VSARENVHATGIVLGKSGIIFRGPSGAGKSLLALYLIEQWESRGLGAKLVADDRLDLEAEKSGLVMHAPAQIAGLAELRGRGIVKRPHVEKAAVHLVVDLVDRMERMVEEDELVTEVLGVALPRCPVPKVGVTELGHQMLLVQEALRALPAGKAPRQKTT
jgi:serine kinase of HPr protein (carbohydrate metabolism regulator)